MAVFLLLCFPNLSPPSAVSMAVQSDGGKEMQELGDWKFPSPANNLWWGARGEVLSVLRVFDM